ncbi:hypothetical protein PR048_010152 [Dryococelus australis]|uniref:Uncharacterized protein n=1 Tax=Dryococelus australis TaxID=614101 RepID=A0ABQ9I1Y3_9NEOP|nr:hypothetical protein PR048_010152 [Dryococelus australis]
MHHHTDRPARQTRLQRPASETSSACMSSDVSNRCCVGKKCLRMRGTGLSALPIRYPGINALINNSSETELLTNSQCDNRAEHLPRRRHRGANPRASDYRSATLPLSYEGPAISHQMNLKAKSLQQKRHRLITESSVDETLVGPDDSAVFMSEEAGTRNEVVYHADDESGSPEEVDGAANVMPEELDVDAAATGVPSEEVDSTVDEKATFGSILYSSTALSTEGTAFSTAGAEFSIAGTAFITKGTTLSTALSTAGTAHSTALSTTGTTLSTAGTAFSTAGTALSTKGTALSTEGTALSTEGTLLGSLGVKESRVKGQRVKGSRPIDIIKSQEWRGNIHLHTRADAHFHLTPMEPPEISHHRRMETQQDGSTNDFGGMQERGKREIAEKTRRPAASSCTTPKCENPGATPTGIEPGSPRWEASSLTTTPPRSFYIMLGTMEGLTVQRYDGNTARLARRGDEALGVRVSVACIAPSLLDLGRSGYTLSGFSMEDSELKVFFLVMSMLHGAAGRYRNVEHGARRPGFLALSFHLDYVDGRIEYGGSHVVLSLCNVREPASPVKQRRTLQLSHYLRLVWERLRPAPINKLVLFNESSPSSMTQLYDDIVESMGTVKLSHWTDDHINCSHQHGGNYLEYVATRTREVTCRRASMVQRRNEGAGEAGDSREGPLTNGIVWHDSHMRKFGVTGLGIEP